jgi:hypothetical protein
MIISRRTFLLDLALAGTTSVLAELHLFRSILVSPAPGLPSSAPELVATGAETKSVLFKIHGWDRADGVAVDGLTSRAINPATEVATSDPVWIRINRSWRTAWR